MSTALPVSSGPSAGLRKVSQARDEPQPQRGPSAVCPGTAGRESSSVVPGEYLWCPLIVWFVHSFIRSTRSNTVVSGRTTVHPCGTSVTHGEQLKYNSQGEKNYKTKCKQNGLRRALRADSSREVSWRHYGAAS